MHWLVDVQLVTTLSCSLSQSVANSSFQIDVEQKVRNSRTIEFCVYNKPKVTVNGIILTED